MSTAQNEALAKLGRTRSMSNDDIYQKMREMRPGVAEPEAMAEELIDFISGGATMSAKEGKRLSQPIYRALSEGAAEGILAESEVKNPETGHANTRYKLLLKPIAPKAKDLTWKAKAALAADELKALKSKYEVCCNTVDKQEFKIAELKSEIEDLRAQLNAAHESAQRLKKIVVDNVPVPA